MRPRLYLLALTAAVLPLFNCASVFAWEPGKYPDIDRVEKKHVLPQKMIDDMRRGRDQAKWIEECRKNYRFKVVRDGKTQEQIDEQEHRVGVAPPMPETKRKQ